MPFFILNFKDSKEMMSIFNKSRKKICSSQNNSYLCNAFREKHFSTQLIGEMVEWSITAVLKTAVPRGTGGSNPSLSAIKGVDQVITRFTPFFTPKNIRLTVRN